jgi:hypothetical protein
MTVLNSEHRQRLLLAERNRDVGKIVEAIAEVTNDAPGATMLDVDMVFRDAGAQTFLVAEGDSGGVKICFGITEARAALGKRTPAENRLRLAGIT